MLDKYLTSENEYIENELIYLYEKIQSYSKLFPDIASKLKFSLNGSDDPHIQLMLESFAILTAKLQRQIDQSTFPITANILDNLHHSGNKPIPAQNIVKFELDETQLGTIENGFTIPKNTIIYKKIDNEFCKYMTETDLTLLPLDIKSVQVEKDVNSSQRMNFIIEIHTIKNKIKALNTNKLKLYINAPKYTRAHFIDLLFDKNTEIFLKDKKNQSVYKLSNKDIKLCHFNEYNTSTEYYSDLHDSTKLIRDYFSFKEKFYYLEITCEDFIKLNSHFEIVLNFVKNQDKDINFKKNYICFNTVPVINLYKKTSEPIKLDNKKTQYKIFSNYNLKDFEKIFCVNEVFYANNECEKILPITDYFPQENVSSTFYELKRSNEDNSEILFNFYSENNINKEKLPIFCNVYVTNGKYGELIYERDSFETDYECPVKKIEALKSSSKFTEINATGQQQWGLLNSYSTNSLPLFEQKLFIKKLKSILQLNGLYFPENYQDINLFFSNIKDVIIMKKFQKKSNRIIDGFVDTFEFNFILSRENSKFESYNIIGEFLLNIIKSYLPINHEAIVKIKKENETDHHFRKTTL